MLLDPETEREFALLDEAIEFKMTGHYPDGLTKDQKHFVKRKAQTIFVEHGKVLIKKKIGKVAIAPLQMPREQMHATFPHQEG